MTNPYLPPFLRLFDALNHWQRAYDNYFSINEFRLSVNAAIQELRNVTFVLQGNKKHIAKFSEWYIPWQDKMRAIPYLRWLVDSRNKIVKQGDLEMKSLLRVSVVGSYFSSEEIHLELNLPPLEGEQYIFQAVLNSSLSKKILSESYIKVQRRWVDIETSEYELLNILSKCWFKIHKLLLDAPDLSNYLNPSDFNPKEVSKIFNAPNLNSCFFKFDGINFVETKIDDTEVILKDKDLKSAKERYSDSPWAKSAQKIPANFVEKCISTFQQAKYILQKDKYHQHIVFMFMPDGKVFTYSMDLRDRSDKYQSMRHVAEKMRELGADKFIMIAEAWVASLPQKATIIHACDSPDKKEALTLVGATKNGEFYDAYVTFNRDNDEINFEDTTTNTGGNHNAISPIIEMWKES